MNRRRFVICWVLILGIGGATTAWSQDTGAASSLAKRLMALRDSLSGASDDDSEEAAPAEEESSAQSGRRLNRSTQRLGTSTARTRVAQVPQTTSSTSTTTNSSVSIDPPAVPPPAVSFEEPSTQATPSEWEHRATTPPTAPPIDRYGLPSRTNSKRLGALLPASELSSSNEARPSPPVHQPSDVASTEREPAETPQPFDSESRPGEPKSAKAFAMKEMVDESQMPIASDEEVDQESTYENSPQAETSVADSQTSSGPTSSSSMGNREEVWGRSEESKSAARQSDSLFGDSEADPWDNRSASRKDSLFADDTPIADSKDNILLVNETPMISSDVSGPKKIMVGREASYRIRVHNQGKVAADQVAVTVYIPSWAEVVETSVSEGIVQRAADAQSPNTLRWQLQRLAGKSEQTLEVKLIPQTTRPMELGVTWTHAPVDSRTVVEVQEPKLEMHVNGPDEVLFGKPQLYRLTLTNPGTGIAENVKIELLPPGGGNDSISSHVVGNLKPGTSKSVEVELTAREAGKLLVKAVATASGGLSSEAGKEIYCRKPELDVDWRGPAKQYAGTMGTFFFRVRNPGSAAAQDVTVEVQLPPGAEFVGASEGQTFDKDRGRVTWRVGSLRPGDDYYMDLRCMVNNPGANRLNIVALTADGMLSNHKTAETNVVALADLVLNVTDPKGPVPIGKEIVYEIRVQNRGTNMAEKVNVVALFSEGIEPHAADGANFGITDGRVSFKPIEKLAAGQSTILRIRAKATKPGTHIFRAEVVCQDLETKLAAEETTRFFVEDIVGGRSSAATTAQRRTMFETQVR